MTPLITLHQVTKVYKKQPLFQDVSFSLQSGECVALTGANGCGKSTTLKALARIWPCYKGNVTFNGEDIKKFSHREFAQKLAILTQAPQSPADLTVKDLVEMGRFPHRNWFGRKSMEDDAHVEWALGQTNMLGMQHRLLSTLSGGERQRAWIAMALAQRPQVLLLDEPTTYLDICHQLEVMQLLEKLNRELQLTVVMVIHDINHAVQYSDHIAVIKEGYLVTEGKPQEIVTAQLLKDVFKVEADEFICSNGMPALLPVDLVK